MLAINPQAVELNKSIAGDNPEIFELFSTRGKAIYFPKEGILAQTAQAKGKKINATIGSGVDDKGLPIRLPSIAQNILLDPKDTFSYAPSYGKLELRQAWQKMIYRKNPSLKAQISLPVVTSALTHGLYLVGYLFCDENDTILLSDKFWGNYRLIYQVGFEAQLKTFNTFKQGRLDLEDFEDQLNKVAGKIVVLLNFPNNPSGYTPTIDEALSIIRILKKQAEKGKKILAIIDDAYFGLIYQKGIFSESLFSHLANLHKNILAVKIDGATKEDYVWGFRVGFIIYAYPGMTDQGAAAFEAKTAGAVRATISNASHLSQSLILNAFKSKTYQKEKNEMYQLLKDRYQTVRKTLENNKYDKFFSPLPYNSGYFMCIELKQGIDGDKLRLYLLAKYDIGVISIGNLIRIAYSSLPKKYIPELFEKMFTACQEILAASK
ncbi:aminotransferase class I/II-fold pyridoxal phosphate-dependent enzyme [Candidatus Gottesmanbacteria bacterium]|nr:aminotransferase class I/II-fold pyridoxal phosphate-dependent enzyme [Candidatus Gottesmanbacteria bacterium]